MLIITCLYFLYRACLICDFISSFPQLGRLSDLYSRGCWFNPWARQNFTMTINLSHWWLSVISIVSLTSCGISSQSLVEILVIIEPIKWTDRWDNYDQACGKIGIKTVTCHTLLSIISSSNIFSHATW
jgi:hypothetical protein